MDMHKIKVDQLLPERIHKPSNVSLFLYNAAIWNPHRIHYDETYTKTFEGHPRNWNCENMRKTYTPREWHFAQLDQGCA